MDWTLAESARFFLAINMVIMGVSHIVQTGAWAKFFSMLASKGTSGVFINGFLHLGFGAIIVAFHPVYGGWPLALTIYGWLLVLKGAVAFCAPNVALRSMEFGAKRAESFRWVGVLLAIFGASMFVTLFI